MTKETRKRCFQELAECAHGNQQVIDSLIKWKAKWVRQFTIADTISEDDLRVNTKNNALGRVMENQSRAMANEFMRAGPTVLTVEPIMPFGGLVVRREITMIWDGKP